MAAASSVMDGERASIVPWTLASGQVSRTARPQSCLFRRVPSDAVSGDITPSFDMSGALGGFNVGCQYQFGWWLIGIEGDGAVTNKDGQAFDLLPGSFFQGKATGDAPD